MIDPDELATNQIREAEAIRRNVGVEVGERIEPALTAEEWEAEIKGTFPGKDENVFLARRGAVTHIGIRSQDTWQGEKYTGAIHASRSALAATIALANHALPDSDPRKITREKVEKIREGAKNAIEDYRLHKPGREDQLAYWQEAIAFADALESYLPSPPPPVARVVGVEGDTVRVKVDYPPLPSVILSKLTPDIFPLPPTDG
jgi:hypothetical protein